VLTGSTKRPRFSATPTNPLTSGQHWAHRRDLLRELIARDVHLRYRGSALGMAWTLLNPLTELLVLMFIFGVVLPIKIPNYAAFLFIGLVAYSWFSSALMFATGAIVNNRELIKRPGVPVGILPIATVASTLVHFLLSLPVLFGLLIVTGVRMTGAVVLLPLVIGIQFVLILSVAYPLAALNVRFRDTQHFLRIGLQLLFYLTPVFYEARMIPERFWTVYRLNPMVEVIEAYRAVLLFGTLPEAMPLLILVLAAIAALVVGIAAFRHASDRFADEL
jgi:lipopolysaccharide transport system permease protein